MRKFAVFSGFLGSGKTTTMMALTRHYTARHGKAAMISNDLGHGVNLADNRFAQLSGCNASEMTDECICYQNENLADRLNAYYDDGCELVISDIPGFGVGALEHVYHGLTEKFPGRFELAPLTVLVEPGTVDILRSGEGGDLRRRFFGKTLRRVEPGADRRAAQRQLIQRAEGQPQQLQIPLQRAAPAADLLGERDGHRVLQVGPAAFHDPGVFLLQTPQHPDQFLHCGQQPVFQRKRRRNVQRCGEGVV